MLCVEHPGWRSCRNPGRQEQTVRQEMYCQSSTWMRCACRCASCLTGNTLNNRMTSGRGLSDEPIHGEESTPFAKAPSALNDGALKWIDLTDGLESIPGRRAVEGPGPTGLLLWQDTPQNKTLVSWYRLSLSRDHLFGTYPPTANQKHAPLHCQLCPYLLSRVRS